MNDYAISKLITVMGMFIHDMIEIKNGNIENVYPEDMYYSFANDVERGYDFIVD